MYIFSSIANNYYNGGVIIEAQYKALDIPSGDTFLHPYTKQRIRGLR